MEATSIVDPSIGKTVHYDKTISICEFIAEQVKKTPEAIAVCFQNTSLTYQELNANANKLANYFLQHRLKPENKIAIYLEPSINTIVCILAILKIGCCYIPLDTSYPIDRIKFMLQDSEAACLVTESILSKNLGTINNNHFVLDLCLDEIMQQSDNEVNLAKGNYLAYVIYTSGSTGVPKGVKISHAAVNNHMLWMREIFRFDVHDKILLKTRFSFDPSVWEIFLPLYCGAQLVIAPSGSGLDPEALVDLVIRYDITTIQFVPSILKEFLLQKNIKKCVSLKRVFVGGDTLRPEIKKLFFDKLSCHLYNLYGPTEATIDITFHQVLNNDIEISTNIIGKPIFNTILYVVDPNLNELAFPGEPGELYIASDSLFVGYHNRDKIQQEKLIANPFDSRKYAKVYKTGDIVKWLSSGELAYLGRNNNQLKINGVRIEPDELILNITSHSFVSDCIIVKKTDTHEHDYLACYLVPAPNCEIDLFYLKNDLKNKFPHYMLPKNYVILEHFPLTLNGKIDMDALPEPDFQSVAEFSHEHNKLNDIERKLLIIWQTTLEVSQIDIDDDFFDCGGDSLSALRLLSEIKKEFQISIRIRELFTFSTITNQAKLVRLLKNDNLDCLKKDNNILIPDPLITLQAKGKKTPLFLVHPIGGTIFWYSLLARLLKQNRPIYGFQDPSIDLEKPVLNSIHEMADFYLQHIKKIQYKGPYIIGGASFGATVAIEMARILAEQGESVAGIIVLDGWGVYPNILLDDSYFKESMLRQHAQLKFDLEKYKLPTPEILFEIQWQRLSLLWQYEMKTINHPIALFKATEMLPAFAEIDHPLNHWDKFTKLKIRSFLVPGNHETMFQEPHVYSLSAEINKYLNELKI